MSQSLTLKRGGVLRTLAGLKAQFNKLERQIIEADGERLDTLISCIPNIKSLLDYQDIKLRKQWNFKQLPREETPDDPK